MKKDYKKPEIIEEVVELEDIIATSYGSKSFDLDGSLTGSADRWYN